MKTLLLATGLLLALSALAQAETIVNGVVYPEITDLGKPRSAAQGQLGGLAMARNVSTPRRAPYFAQLPPPPVTGSKVTTLPPADLRPTITSGPTVQSVPGYNQAAYGHGYTSVGTPQRVVYVQPATYTNTVPVQHAVPVQRAVAVQPVTNVQPLGGYDPYATSPGVPWRPIGNLRPMPPNYVVGQGIIGQPKVYVPSQPIRNFIRYITP